jgi:hypothetical protein
MPDTLLTQSSNPYKPAGSSPDAALNAMARDLTPEELASLNGIGGKIGNLQLSGAATTPTGVMSFGEDQGSNQYQLAGFAGFSPTSFQDAHYGGSGWQNQYDPSGKFLGQQYIAPPSGFEKGMSMLTEALLAYAFGNVAAGAAGAAGAGGAADSSLTVQGNSINALDAGSAGLEANGGVAIPYGSEPGSSFLTGPTSVNADYSLTGGVQGTQIGPLEGNAGTGLNVSSNSGTGLQFNTSPNMASMGGAQGLTTTGAQTLGDASSFINDPALNVADAGQQVISEPGIYTPQNPYTPDLGDPNSFINGGTGGVTTPATPVTAAPGVAGGGVTAGAGAGSTLLNTISQVLPVVSAITTALTPTPDDGTQTTALSPSYTPPQPEVGAGEYANAAAQGGASGSMAGVAGTLLTAKDTFGYGKSMLT